MGLIRNVWNWYTQLFLCKHKWENTEEEFEYKGKQYRKVVCEGCGSEMPKQIEKTTDEVINKLDKLNKLK